MTAIPSVSVCMATFNGAAFVEQQLRSILDDLPADAEVIVVDDASTDDTVDIVSAIDDPRLTVSVSAQNSGYVKTFERAIAQSRGEVILLSDQDDIWIPGRTARLVAALSGSDVVASNLEILSPRGPLVGPLGQSPWQLQAADSRRRWHNIFAMFAGAAPYFGCAMGFTRTFTGVVMPFPRYLNESHDLWLALCGNAAKSIVHIEDVTVLRRLHDSNASPSRPRRLSLVLRARVMLVRAAFDALRRARRFRRTA